MGRRKCPLALPLPSLCPSLLPLFSPRSALPASEARNPMSRAARPGCLYPANRGSKGSAASEGCSQLLARLPSAGDSCSRSAVTRLAILGPCRRRAQGQSARGCGAGGGKGSGGLGTWEQEHRTWQMRKGAGGNLQQGLSGRVGEGAKPPCWRQRGGSAEQGSASQWPAAAQGRGSRGST